MQKLRYIYGPVVKALIGFYFIFQIHCGEAMQQPHGQQHFELAPINKNNYRIIAKKYFPDGTKQSQKEVQVFLKTQVDNNLEIINKIVSKCNFISELKSTDLLCKNNIHLFFDQHLAIEICVDEKISENDKVNLKNKFLKNLLNENFLDKMGLIKPETLNTRFEASIDDLFFLNKNKDWAKSELEKINNSNEELLNSETISQRGQPTQLEKNKILKKKIEFVLY